MLTSLAVCGDSFGVGVGISDKPHEIIDGSFGAQVAQHYNVPLKMFARSGCCNYVIYLQVKKIIEQFQIKKINPFVLITTTHHSRFVFPNEIETGYISYDLSEVDYKTYNFFPTEEELKNFLPFELKEKPKLTSDTISNILHLKKFKLQNLKKLFTNIEQKMDIVSDYLDHLYSDSIKQDYDSSLIVMIHSELKYHNIPHLILTPNEYLSRFINQENFLKNDWGYYSKKYPDIYGSGHCTAQGHKELSEKIIEKMSQLNTLFN